MGCAVLPCEQGSAGGDATGSRGVGSRKIRALICQAVEVVGTNQWIAIDSEGVPALLVGSDEEDVGFQSRVGFRL